MLLTPRLLRIDTWAKEGLTLFTTQNRSFQTLLGATWEINSDSIYKRMAAIWKQCKENLVKANEVFCKIQCAVWRYSVPRFMTEEL